MTSPRSDSAFDALIREAEPVLVDDHTTEHSPPLGPDSLVWKFYGDVRGLLGFQRLAGTENCIEQLGKAVEDHSVIFSGHPRAGTAQRAADHEDSLQRGSPSLGPHRPRLPPLHQGHDLRRVPLPRAQPGALLLGARDIVDQVLYVTDTFIRRLSYDEKVRIFEESKSWYALYGVSARNEPQTYEEFVEYWNAMLDRFVATKTIVYATGYIRKGVPRPRRIPAPVGPSVRADRCVHPQHRRRDPSGPDARGLRAGVEREEGEALPPVRGDDARLESDVQPAPARRALPPLGARRVAASRRRSPSSAQPTGLIPQRTPRSAHA